MKSNTYQLISNKTMENNLMVLLSETVISRYYKFNIDKEEREKKSNYIFYISLEV